MLCVAYTNCSGRPHNTSLAVCKVPESHPLSLHGVVAWSSWYGCLVNALLVEVCTGTEITPSSTRLRKFFLSHSREGLQVSNCQVG